jgi:methionyl aminopeptidase
MLATSPRDISDARAAAQCVVETHRRLAQWLRVGLTLAEVDSFCVDVFKELKCESAFKGYKVRGHPPFKSHTCLSLNDMVVHGEHDSVVEPLKEGDLLATPRGPTPLAPPPKWVCDCRSVAVKVCAAVSPLFDRAAR